MVISKSTLLSDILYFIKNDLLTNITDPISSTRQSKSKFVVTSYPQREVVYPLISIKIPNIIADRAGMQTSNQDFKIDIELRVWARNEKEKDNLYTNVINRLANIQFNSGTGSVANGLHDFTILSSVEIDEEGEGSQVIKSRITRVQYHFYG